MKGKYSRHLLSLIFVGSLLFQAGCIGTTANYAIREQPTLSTAKPEQALVYVYRTSYRAPGSVVEIYWKRKIVGVLPRGTYFHFYADPGSQLIGAHLGANSGSTNVTLKSGEVYYLKQDFSLVGVTTLEVVAAEEGRAAVSTLKYTELLPPKK
jgi:hypothetical protein